MRNWKNWLFPLLTCLTVAALALLPLRLSALQDRQLTGTIHAEPLAEDNNFPFKPPELPGRLWLLVQWSEMPEQITIMAQELGGAEREREIQRLQKALLDLEDVLPPGIAELLTSVDGYSWDWERYYLRDQKDLSSASFSLAGTYDKDLGISFTATLDTVSGQIIGLQAYGARVGKFIAGSSPLETGKALLDHWGLDYVPVANFDTIAYFRLPECTSYFLISHSDLELSFSFHVDWETLDSETAESYGHPNTSAAGSSVDADMMQKW